MTICIIHNVLSTLCVYLSKIKCDVVSFQAMNKNTIMYYSTHTCTIRILVFIRIIQIEILHMRYMSFYTKADS